MTKKLRWAARTVVAMMALGSTTGVAAAVEPGRAGPTAHAALARAHVVFQLVDKPGFVTQEYALGIRPAITVYSDGGAYVTADDPGPATTVGLVAARVRPRLLGELVARARRSSLFGADYGAPMIADVGTTVLRFRPDHEPVMLAEAYALGSTNGLTRAQRAARRQLSAFIARLRAAVPVPPPPQQRQWRPRRIDITVVGRGNGLPGPAIRYDGPPLSVLLDARRDGLRCGALVGAAADRIFTRARNHDGTLWDVRGRRRDLVVRALLPGEPACR